MILIHFIILRLSLADRECKYLTSFGKINIGNKSNDIIRVSLLPAISWDYLEQRSNKTLLRNPGKNPGGNHIL